MRSQAANGGFYNEHRADKQGFTALLAADDIQTTEWHQPSSAKAPGWFYFIGTA
jgi:hypothetical protein